MFIGVHNTNFPTVEVIRYHWMIIPAPQMKENHVAIWMHGDHTVVNQAISVPDHVPK